MVKRKSIVRFNEQQINQHANESILSSQKRNVFNQSMQMSAAGDNAAMETPNIFGLYNNNTNPAINSHGFDLQNLSMTGSQYDQNPRQQQHHQAINVGSYSYASSPQHQQFHQA